MSGDLTRGWGTSRIISAKICRTQLDRATSTVLTAVPNCSHFLQSGGMYTIEAHITGTATANGGAKATIAASDGTLTATSFTLSATNRNNATTNAAATVTTLGSAVAGATAAFTDYVLLGSIVVNHSGLAALQFAQNASHSDTSSAYVGTYVKFTRVY